MDRAKQLKLTKFILLALAEAPMPPGGMPSGKLWATIMTTSDWLLPKTSIHEYHELISLMVDADLIVDRDPERPGRTSITHNGCIVLERLIKNPNVGELTMAAKKTTTEKPAAETEQKIKFGPKKRKAMRIKAAKRFPKLFMLKGKEHKDQVYFISSKKSRVNKFDGEIKLALFKQGTTLTDESVPDVKLTPKGLKMALRKIPKAKREGNIPMMIRLLTEGKSMKEIVAAYTERYHEIAKATGKEHKESKDWVQARCDIYANIASKQDEGAKKALKKLRPKKAKVEKPEEKPAKGKKKSKPAKEAEEETEDADEEEADEPEEKPAKKKGGKKPAKKDAE